MTPAPSVGHTPSSFKYAILAILGVAGALYLSAYFFLLFLKLSPLQANPLTIPRYAYYYWEKPEVRSRLLGATGLGALLVGGLALALLLPNRRTLHGNARFATAGAMRKAGLFSDHGIILGKYRRRYLMLPGQTGVILAARPRSWKGVSCVIPNLLNWSGSSLTLDPKIENYTVTAGYRSLFDEVYLFNPFATDGRTSRWNMLTYVSDNPYLRIDDVQRIATMLFQEVPGADPFWVKSARSLFVGIALYLFERRDYERAYNADPTHSEKMIEVPVTVGEVLRQGMASDEEGFSKHWKRIVEGWAALGKPLSPQCTSLIMDVVDLATQTASSVRKTLTSQLDLWMNPLLDMATAESDFDLRDLRKKRISIYLGIKPRDFERLQSVMNVFFQQAIGEQTAELPEHNPELKHQLLVILDEFTAVGRIPILLNSIAFVPGYNVRTLMIIQTPSQLDEVYGQNGKKIMLKTLGARIVFAPNDMEDARSISEELGYTTVKSRSRNVPGVGGGRNRSPSTNISDQKRALMLPQEIKEMPTDRELVFVENLLPIKCHKIKYFEDKIFKSRLLPAPGIAKQDVSNYSGNRTDDHFAMWQQLIQRPLSTRAPATTESAKSAPLASTAPATEFSLDFSTVQIPEGRYMSEPEIDAAVNSFLDELESA
ncbi:MAG TPA: type IV secretory system conjugative DNA transfer family protein [Steroidobacteraceae bacterium]